MSVTKLTGKLVRVHKYRGEAKNVVGRVVSVRDTHLDPITHQSYRRNPITRSRYIVKVLDVTDGKYRDYYDDFLAYKQVGLFGRLIVWLTSAFKRSK